jgi:hypothetical protein
MDRRKVIVGGGATALATALAAAGLRSAQASTTAAGPISTTDHARQVLTMANADLGVVNPVGLQSQFQHACAAYAASPAPAPGAPATMETWTQQRMANLCGTESFVAAATEVPETRTLLSFALLASSQHQKAALPQVNQGMSVPAVLKTLEPDFFPVLLNQTSAKSSGSPAFINALQAGSAQLDQIVTTFGAGNPTLTPQARRLTDLQIAALVIIAIVNLALLKTDGWG